MKWTDIPRFPHCNYEVSVPWSHIERTIAEQTAPEIGLDLDPDFQRAHVWTEAQRSAYIEYALMGGEVGRNLTFVCTEWNKYPSPGYAILDGKQRLESVRRFLRGEVRVFADSRKPEGYTRADIDGPLSLTDHRFNWRIVVCKTKADVLRLYLQINAGGTPHSPEELERVRAMLREVGG